MIEKRFRTIRLAAALVVGITAGCALQFDSSPNTASKGESCPKGVEGLVEPHPLMVGGFTNHLGNVDWSVTQCPPYPSNRIRIEATDPNTLSQLLEVTNQVCGVLDKKGLNNNSLDVATGKENCLLLLPLQ